MQYFYWMPDQKSTITDSKVYDKLQVTMLQELWGYKDAYFSYLNALFFTSEYKTRQNLKCI